MNLDEIISVTKGKLVNKYKNMIINSFKTDTRIINKEDAFIALKGNNYDGNSFINDNLDCKLVITDKDIKLENIPVIKVDNTYDTLYYLTQYKLSKYKIPVIAITGSNGKTTLKELIYNILSTKYNVLKNDGNKNNIIGVFETINSLESKHEIVVLELGMNHKGEIKNAGLNGYSKGSSEPAKPEPSRKSNEELADEVINGNWGNGEDRKRALTNAGYDYAAVQAIVNAKLGVTPKPSARYYTVVKGDTLWAIAKKYYGDGNRYPEIARANNIANPNIIHIGQKLLIP